jgi:hypothetical protein
VETCSSITTCPGMTCDLDVPASSSSIAPPRKEPGVLTAACGGALGTVLALAALACLLLFFDGDHFDMGASQAAARSEPRLVHNTAVSREKRMATEPTDVLRTTAAVRAPAPPRGARPHHSHHVARSPARKSPAVAADLAVTNALARAELASSLP